MLIVKYNYEYYNKAVKQIIRVAFILLIISYIFNFILCFVISSLFWFRDD